MWGIVQTIIISIIIIVAIHYSYQYLRDTLTPRKTKDVVGFQKQKFDEIISELQQAKLNAVVEADTEAELLEFANEQINNISKPT
jgi:hypothetical protein|uniref:Uncharacterized protein n=1 Tax=viral metagenome TaxID=1070528 RepID=A0A6C0F4Q5_9ZZZZ